MEYKFRGQRVDNKEWVYGNLISSIIFRNSDDIYSTGWNKNGSAFFKFEGVPVEEDSICQYTGLKDKHGKEIYSGDIVKTAPYGEIAEIKYSDHFQRLHLHFKGDYREHLKNELGIHIFDWIYPEPSLEVIGNKFDNPELLEVK